MHSQNYWQLKNLNTQNTLHPRFSGGTEAQLIPAQSKSDYLQERLFATEAGQDKV